MKAKQIRPVIAGACLGCLVHSLACAQPSIIHQPRDQLLRPGQSLAYFIVNATGAPPVAYQWYFDGLAFAGATNYSIVFTNALSAQGDYFVIVSNAQGSVTSRVARLKVFVANPPSHSFGSLVDNPGEAAALSLLGDTSLLFAPYYDLFPVEVSSDLLNWAPLGLLQRTNAEVAPLTLVDTNAAALSKRFYRTPTNRFVTFLPQPSGRFTVGVISRLLTDPSRTNRRPFMISIWYPAEAKAGVWPDNYMHPKIAYDYGANWTGFGSTCGSIYGSFRTHAQPSVPLNGGQTNYPVLLYSHAHTGVRTENTAHAEHLASQGYVVVAIDDNGTWESVYPDGEVIYYADPPLSIGDNTTFAKLTLANMQDMQSVIDQLTAWNEGDPFFQGRLDLERIGAFGWALGGGNVVQLCAKDPRCKAAVIFDGGASTPLALFSQPLLYVGGDSIADYITAYFWSSWVTLFNQRTNDAYMFQIKSAVTMDFSDLALTCDPTQSSYALPTDAQIHMAALLRTYTLSFFDKYLKGQDDHTLDGPLPDYPEIQNYRKK